MKYLSIFLLILITFANCIGNGSNSDNNLMRMFTFFGNTSNETLSLSITGTLSQDGTTVSNTLIATNASSLNTSTSVKGRSTGSEGIRCIDHDLAEGSLRCLLIIQTANITTASNGCYRAYLGSSTNNKLQLIATFNSITVGQEIKLLHQGDIPAGATNISVYSCNNGSEDLLATSTFVDYTSSNAILTNSNGTYTVSLESGKYHTMNIRRPSKDLGDIIIDLSAVNDTAGLEQIQNDTSQLAIAIPSGFSHDLVVNGPVTVSNADTNTGNLSGTNSTTGSTGTSTSGTTIDLATLSTEASKDSNLTPGTTTLPSGGGTTTGAAPSGLSYSGSPFTFTQNTAITSQTPTVTGSITSCTASPALPTGLVLDNSTCSISGTPALDQVASDYTITAANDFGNATATINVTIQAKVSQPTFSIAAGTYNSDQSVALSTTTAGATIYYTTDGSTPTTSSTLYSVPIAVAGHTTSMTINALAVKAGILDSSISSGTFTITYDTVVQPAFSVAAGTYNSDQSVALSTTTAGATIYYTTDGSTPTTSSTLYSVPIAVAGHTTSMTIKALAVKSGMLDSSVASAAFTISYDTVSQPTFNIPAGTYTGAQLVTLSSTTGGATIRYTTDGSNPTCSTGTVYSSAINISTNLTLKAIGCAGGMLDSSIASAAYSIQFTIAGTVSGLSGTVDLQNNGGDNISISSNGGFIFPTAIASGGAYSVTILNQPSGQFCSVSNGSGTATANVTNVNISCSAVTYTIGGTLSGLIGTVVLQNNSGDNLSISSNGSFTFSTPIVTGGAYSVTILTQPITTPPQTCIVSSGSGTATANVTSVNISCNCGTDTYPWGTFTDMCNATVKLEVAAGTWGLESYSATTLYYMKCNQGQTWNSSTNTCDAGGNGNQLYYCILGNNNCNGGSDSGTLDGGGTSEIWNTCDTLTFDGHSDWRVPTINELRLLIKCSNPTNVPENGTSCTNSTLSLGGTSGSVISNLFPNTQTMYWSSSSSSAFASWIVNFGNSNVALSNKQNTTYVRCVRTGP